MEINWITVKQQGGRLARTSPESTLSHPPFISTTKSMNIHTWCRRHLVITTSTWDRRVWGLFRPWVSYPCTDPCPYNTFVQDGTFRLWRTLRKRKKPTSAYPRPNHQFRFQQFLLILPRKPKETLSILMPQLAPPLDLRSPLDDPENASSVLRLPATQEEARWLYSSRPSTIRRGNLRCQHTSACPGSRKGSSPHHPKVFQRLRVVTIDHIGSPFIQTRCPKQFTREASVSYLPKDNRLKNCSPVCNQMLNPVLPRRG